MANIISADDARRKTLRHKQLESINAQIDTACSRGEFECTIYIEMQSFEPWLMDTFERQRYVFVVNEINDKQITIKW